MALITVLEFTDSDCKVAQAERSRNKASLKVLFTVALPRNEDPAARIAQRAHLLKEAVRVNKLRAQRVTVIVPKNYVMSRMVTLPSTDEQELVGMARFEADRHIPFNAERHIVSFSVLNKLGVQGSQVLLTAMDQPIAQEYLDICLGAGLQVEQISVSTISLFNAFSYANVDVMADKVVALVNIGLSNIDICLIHNGIMTFSRSATIGISKLITDVNEADSSVEFSVQNLKQVDALEPHVYFRTPANAYDELDLDHGAPTIDLASADALSSGTLPAVDASMATAAVSVPPGSPEFTPSVMRMLFTNWLLRLLQEVRKTYEYARREFNIPMIDQVYLSGEGATIQNLSQFFNVNFNIPTSVFNGLTSVEVPTKLVTKMDGMGQAFSTIVGAVIPPSARHIGINLLPTRYIEAKQTKRQKQSFITTGAFAFIAIMLTYVWLSNVFDERANELTALQGVNTDFSAQVADLKAKEVRLGIIETYVKDEHGALDVLERVSNFPFIPEKISFRDIKYDKGASVRFTGYGKEIADINHFQAGLEDTGLFAPNGVTQDSGTGNMTALPNRGKAMVYDFIVTAKFKQRETKKKSSKNTENKEENNGTE